MNIFSKFSSNEYNNRLEQILENKKFNVSVKNLLLSMLYKIETGYNDYSRVKIDIDTKEQYMEKVLNIIQNKCEEIEIVTPKTAESKPLEDINAICKIEQERGYILVYANEEDLLYSLFQMEYICKQEEKIKKAETDEIEDLIKQSIKEFGQVANSINKTEIIRDFDGWSWNNSIKKPQNIAYNLIYQNILIMLGTENTKKFFYNDEKIRSKLIKENNEFIEDMNILILAISALKNSKIKNKINEIKEQRTNLLELMNNRIKFLEFITSEKKRINVEIKNIDEILNDKEKLKEEYYSRNSKLANKDKIFSISHLADRMENERTEKLKELKQKNKMIEPVEFLKQREICENEMKFLDETINNINSEKERNKTIIKLQKDLLKAFASKAEKIETKEKLIENIYRFRYYCLIPISNEKTIKDVLELQEEIQNTINVIIDYGIDKEIITNFSNSASLCYNILKYVFMTKIIDLNEISIKINKVDGENITVKIYDAKETEHTYEEQINNLEFLNVKLNKKIKVFI